jgi:uncharacterized membrane protein YGL010W
MSNSITDWEDKIVRGYSAGSKHLPRVNTNILTGKRFNILLSALQHSMRFRSPFFIECDTLLSDLSFSYYFHSTLYNQLFHLFSLLLVIPCIMTLLCYISYPATIPIIAAILVALYTTIYIQWDFWTGLLWFLYNIIWIILAQSYTIQTFLLDSDTDTDSDSDSTSTSYNMTVVLLCCMIPVLLLIQLIGHIVFEGKLPAFRYTEAVLTTPFFLFLNALFWCGYKPLLRDAIHERGPQWITWDRRHYKKQQHPQAQAQAQAQTSDLVMQQHPNPNPKPKPKPKPKAI